MSCCQRLKEIEKERERDRQNRTSMLFLGDMFVFIKGAELTAGTDDLFILETGTALSV